MEIVLNDYSISNQFDTYQSFEAYYRNTLVHILRIIVEKNMPLFKVEDILRKPLIEGEPLCVVFRKANQSALTQMKIYLRKMMASPFLEDVLRTVDGVDYDCPFSSDIPNCFTEAIERKCPVLSFPHVEFTSKQIACKRDKIDYLLPNILDKDDVLWNLLCNAAIEIRYILENLSFSKKVKLAVINDRCYAEEALLSLGHKDLYNIARHINDLIRDKSGGSKTRFWDSIKSDKVNLYEYRMSISSGREFRLFFIWGESLVFLNGFIKKTEETPKHEIEKAEKIARQLYHLRN